MKPPVVRQVSWPATIPQFAFLTIAMLLGNYFVSTSNGVLIGASVYLAYSFGSRMLIARDHQRGMSLTRGLRYAEAIPYFANSYKFFSDYAWIDRYRSVLLMSASQASYREMALCNIAFCYSQIGDGQRAEKYYHQAVNEFPDSGLARTALRLIESAKATIADSESEK